MTHRLTQRGAKAASITNSAHDHAQSTRKEGPRPKYRGAGRWVPVGPPRRRSRVPKTRWLLNCNAWREVADQTSLARGFPAHLIQAAAPWVAARARLDTIRYISCPSWDMRVTQA